MIIYSPLNLADEAGRIDALRRYEILDTAPEAAFSDIVALMKRIFGAPMACFSLIDESRQWFKVIDGLDLAETARSESFCDYTIQSAEPMVIPDATRDARFANNPYVVGPTNIRSYLGAPLTTPDGYNVGAICVMYSEPRIFSAAETEMIQSFARIIVRQLEMQLALRRDTLTGCLSRRVFELHLQNSVAAFGKDASTATLALLDLDRFKSINDTYGHPVGDIVLKQVAATVQSVLRQTDYFGRLGGEEFGILFDGLDMKRAGLIAERVRAAISALVLPELGGRLVTASLGLIQLSPSVGTVAEWVRATDAALYRAKSTGRNRIACAA